jgi:hypothetical protein
MTTINFECKLLIVVLVAKIIVPMGSGWFAQCKLVIAPISIDNGFSLVLKFLSVATFFEILDPDAGRLTS